MAVLIQNGTVIGVEGRRVADVRCRNGRIVEIGPGLEPLGEDLLDAGGAFVLPGGVDPHVHLSLPVAGTVSADDFESGTRAAIAGGTTTLIDFVHPERGEPFREALRRRLAEAVDARIDYGFHMAVTWWDSSGNEQIRECVEAGVTTFKAYLAYKDTVGIDDDVLSSAMAAIGRAEGMLLVHAENGEAVEALRQQYVAAGQLSPEFHALSRPPDLEGEATARAIALATTAGALLYVVHVTCRDSLEAIARARSSGAKVVGETCPHYLLLDDSVYSKPDFGGAAYICAPPIRAIGHQEPLWRALEEDVLSVVATDHCPFTSEQRELGRHDFRLIPGGTPGIEHRLSLLHTHGVVAGRFGLERFVELISTRPAKLFGLYPRKGVVAVGSDADLVIWDAEARTTLSAATHRHRCDQSIYEGFETQGAASSVVVAGELAYADGEFLPGPSRGRFLVRHFPELLERAERAELSEDGPTG